MSRYRFELATAADDADLRRILAETPMPGAISLAFVREPSFFDAAVVDGRFRQIVAARDCETNHIVGFGVRSLMERYVNGRAEAIGYLSNLRLLAEHRNRGLVPRGYAMFRRLHRDGRARLYLTTIAEDNRAAQVLLTSGRSGLPGYHFAGRFHTFVIPLNGRASGGRKPPVSTQKQGASAPRSPVQTRALFLRPAGVGDLPMVLEFLHRIGPQRQFFPSYRADDFLTPGGIFRDLAPGDILLAFRNDELVGTLAAWDQRAFRQTVVHGYHGLLRWLRPCINMTARIFGRPKLPAIGEPIPFLTAALPVIAEDDPAIFQALVDATLAERAHGPWRHFLIGAHEADPLLPLLRRYRARCYTTRLYLVGWSDGEELRLSLDGRPPYLELGTL